MRRGVRAAVVLCSIALALTTSARVVGQQQAARPAQQSVGASAGTLGQWDARVDAMLREGTLDFDRLQTDTMMAGRTHERLGQRHENLPVFGGQLIRQMDGRSLVSVFGQFFGNVSLPTVVPSIDGAAAAAIAERAAGEGASAAAPVLGILPKDDGYVLVYRTKVRSSWDIRTYFVNARTGAVERTLSEIKHQQDVPTIGLGTGVLGDKKKVSSAQSSSTYRAIDLKRPADAFTLDFRGSVTRLNNFFNTGTVFLSDVATSSSPDWTDPAIVDAHTYEGWVYDFYFKQFGRHGLDDQDIPIISIVHPLARSEASRFSPDVVGTFINNAAYLGDGFIFLGDGDGRIFDYLAGGLDVVGHELTHGVTDFTSSLEYIDESGALNEAFSDIMGTAIEFYYQKPGQGPQKGPNFLIGEDVTKVTPGFIRSAQNPISAGDPDHYSIRQFIGTGIDNGGVHVNCSIVTHAFYLSVVGGTNRVSGINVSGIGLANMDRMERVFYRAFAFLMGPRSQFRDARAATLQSATDLYGANSNERAQLAQAWTAVGVQ